jgi:hypothetical protein
MSFALIGGMSFALIGGMSFGLIGGMSFGLIGRPQSVCLLVRLGLLQSVRLLR